MTSKTEVLVLGGISILLWAYCGGLIAVGQSIMSMDATLVLHAIGAPIGAAVAAWAYQRFFGHFSPLATALAFVGTAVFLDVFVVAMLVEKSFEMFASPIGTWIPLALIFVFAFAVGRLARRQ